MSKIWIMTLPQSEMSKRVLIRLLRIRAKRWQFGIETGHNTGYEHYQIRYECSNGDFTRERAFWTGYRCELQEGGGWSNYELKSGYFYTSVDDTLGKYRFSRLRELQHCILSHGRKQGDRKITAVIDKCGGTGKTFLARWMCLNGRGTYIDGTGDSNGIVAGVYDISEEMEIECLVIDLTRNTNANRTQLWAAIETIKNGYLKDSRYRHREKWIRPPKILVFTNNEPKWERLSSDRWDKIFLKEKEDKIIMYDYPIVNGEKKSRVRNFNRNN